MNRLIPLLLCAMLLLTGCWDQKDIETRGYVLGVAIDRYPPIPQDGGKGTPEEASPQEEEKLEKMELHTGQPVYAMTLQLPIVSKAKAASAGTGGGGSGEGSRTWEITQIGNSFMSINREIHSRTSLFLNFEHLQAIILSEEVAKEGIEKILDFFLRDPEMRRRVKVFISQGEAKKILDVIPRMEDYSSLYLARLPKNAVRNSRMVHKLDLGEAVVNIHGGYAFVLPKVQATKDEIKSSGGAAFKGDRMVGWISELEMEALKFIRNLYMGGVVTVKAPGFENGMVTLEITKARSRVTPLIEDGDVRFQVNIQVECNYGEATNMHSHGKITGAFLEKLELECSREIQRICMQTIRKAQKELETDIFLFDHILETEKPAFWKEVGKQWNSIFPNVEVEVKVDTDIILIGLVK